MRLNEVMASSGDETLLEADQWRSEAAGVIQDVQEHVRNIEVSSGMQSSNQFIYLNMTTVEGSDYCVELSANGFRVVGNAHNDQSAPRDRYYETPYALLDHISPGYARSFGNSLLKKLVCVQLQNSDDEGSM